MKHISLLFLVFIIKLDSIAQIKIEDSSAQAIGYWHKNEKMSYTITLEKYKLKDEDTTNREKTTYDVDITILDSSAKSYTIEWLYKNSNTKSENKLVNKLSALVSKNMKVIIKTDENGMFSEVVNWKEISSYISNSCDKLKSELKDPDLDILIKQIQKIYSSKEAIESVAIADIQQFYNFHGAQYKLEEPLSGKIQVPNLIGGKPLDCQISVILEEIDTANGSYILSSLHSVDKDQLTEVMFNYLVNLAEKMKTKLPTRDELGEFKNETLIRSRIHDLGWVMSSYKNKTITSDEGIKVEETMIDIKEEQ